jgi:hypothetical protein
MRRVKKRRVLFLVMAGLLVAVTTALVPTTRYIALGIWRGEHFYKGRPSCYWIYHLQDMRKSSDMSTGRAWGQGLRSSAPSWSRFLSEGVALWQSVTTRPADDVETDTTGNLYQDAPTWTREFGGDPAAAPVLLELIRSDSPSVRTDAVWGLAQTNPPPGEAVRAVIGALDDSNCFVRNNAMVALGRMGPAARDAVPALVRLWEKAEYLAGDALQRIDPETAKHAHPLVWTEE